MIAVIIAHDAGHAAQFAKAHARLRAAETEHMLDRAIVAMDRASTAVMAAPIRTRADVELRQRAIDWIATGATQASHARKEIAQRDAYRKRRVSPDRLYMQKSTAAREVRP